MFSKPGFAECLLYDFQPGTCSRQQDRRTDDTQDRRRDDIREMMNPLRDP
jgi:hypothetical protein